MLENSGHSYAFSAFVLGPVVQLTRFLSGYSLLKLCYVALLVIKVGHALNSFLLLTQLQLPLPLIKVAFILQLRR